MLKRAPCSRCDDDPRRHPVRLAAAQHCARRVKFKPRRRPSTLAATYGRNGAGARVALRPSSEGSASVRRAPCGREACARQRARDGERRRNRREGARRAARPCWLLSRAREPLAPVEPASSAAEFVCERMCERMLDSSAQKCVCVAWRWIWIGLGFGRRCRPLAARRRLVGGSSPRASRGSPRRAGSHAPAETTTRRPNGSALRFVFPHLFAARATNARSHNAAPLEPSRLAGFSLLASRLWLLACCPQQLWLPSSPLPSALKQRAQLRQAGRLLPGAPARH